METLQKGILVGGLIVAAALLVFVDPYLAGIAVILVICLTIAFQIMGETRSLPPRLTCWLTEDAKMLVIRNEGNDRAVRIHITLVPQDMQFELPELEVEGRHEFPLPTMLAEAKAVVNYENAAGKKFSRSVLLSATGTGEEDLLKPVFPIFGWK
jgi:hypothetical protein